MYRNTLMISFLMLFILIGTAKAEPQWLTLPPTPTLPKADNSGYANINGVRIWHAEFGQGQPVILLHGGFANSNYWGNQVRELSKHYLVVVMDSRGHGRSSSANHQTYSYDLMASDVIGLMNLLKIRKATIIGWSDGAIIGLKIAIEHPERVSRLFAFAANSSPSGVGDISKNPLFNAYIARTKKEYEKLSPSPTNYKDFLTQINKMWATEPNITKEQLNNIHVPTWIVDGDHDEAIKREDTEFMAAQIPNAGLLIQPRVSHFSFLQDPEQFNDDVLHFLKHVSTR